MEDYAQVYKLDISKQISERMHIEVTNKGELDLEIFKSIDTNNLLTKYEKFRVIKYSDDGLFCTILYAFLENCFQTHQVKPLYYFFRMINNLERESIFSEYCETKELHQEMKNYIQLLVNKWTMEKHSMKQLADMNLNDSNLQPFNVLGKMFEKFILPIKENLLDLQTPKQHAEYFSNILANVGNCLKYNLKILYYKNDTSILSEYNPENPIPQNLSFGDLTIFINQKTSYILYTNAYAEAKARKGEENDKYLYNKLLRTLAQLVYKSGELIECFPKQEQYNLISLIEEVYSIGLNLHRKTIYSEKARNIGKMFKYRDEEDNNTTNTNILTVIMEAYSLDILYTKAEEFQFEVYNREPQESMVCLICKGYECTQVHSQGHPHYYCVDCLHTHIKDLIEQQHIVIDNLICLSELCPILLTDNLNERAIELLMRIKKKNNQAKEDSKRFGSKVEKETKQKFYHVDSKTDAPTFNVAQVDQYITDDVDKPIPNFAKTDLEEAKTNLIEKSEVVVENTPKAQAEKTIVERKCEICQEKRIIHDVWQFVKCDHNVCFHCVRQFINKLLTEEENCLLSFSCPVTNCNQPMHNHEIQHFVGGDILEQLSLKTAQCNCPLHKKGGMGAKKKNCYIF